MRRILSLSNNPKIFSKFGNVILCDKVLSEKFQKDKVSIVQNLPENRKKVNSIYDYCEKKYLVLLKDLQREFNKIHKLKYPIRYWEILIGRWLIDFIFVC